MKKLSLILIFSSLLATNLVAQKDSSFHVAIIFKINPGLMLTYQGPTGEFGGSIQINASRRVAFFAGWGFNSSSCSTVVRGLQTNPTNYNPGYFYGYTVRWGAYYFFHKHEFVSLQMFYRVWKPTIAFNFEDGKSSYDNVTFPIQAINDGSDEEAFTINNCWSKVFDYSVLYGEQFTGRRTHLFFEWYVGTGLRFKTINTQQLGQVDVTGVYYPPSGPIYNTSQSIFPEIKLGIQVGYKF